MRREALREYAAGSLWVLPSVSALAALMAGSVLSLVNIGPESPLAPVVFQGTADDARALLIGIAGTVVTVIALVLGLTVVALQLSSTQFSPRLLRNFLRDRPNQVVLSIFVATFAYAAAGLYTVGVSAGSRTAEYPRLAVSGALVLLFGSLVMLVFFVHHLTHSIQIDAITRSVERATMAVIEGRLGSDEASVPAPPEWAVRLLARRSGYLQTAHPEAALPLAQRDGVVVRLRPRVAKAPRWPGSGGHRPVTRLRTPPLSNGNCTRRSGSGSSGPWSRTWASACGSWSTSRARRCPRRSTTHTRLSKRSTTCPCCSAHSLPGHSAPTSHAIHPAPPQWSSPAARSASTSPSRAA